MGKERSRMADHLILAEEAALRLLSDTQLEVNLVLTDLDMPRINGFEVIRALQLYRPEVPVVAMSNA
jgi:CheY-like chemotaxis protein